AGWFIWQFVHSYGYTVQGVLSGTHTGDSVVFFFKQKTAYEIGLGIPAEPLFRSTLFHTPTAISIFVCLSMVQLMAVFISMRCTLCGHFLQVALTLILVVGYAIAVS